MLTETYIEKHWLTFQLNSVTIQYIKQDRNTGTLADEANIGECDIAVI